MRLFDRWRLKRMKDPVRGFLTIVIWEAELFVHGGEGSAGGSLMQSRSGTLTGVVSGPGIDPQPIEFRAREPRGVSLDLSHSYGDRLPVIVDRDGLRTAVIVWDEVPVRTAAALRRELAQKEADRQRSRTASAATVTTASATVARSKKAMDREYKARRKAHEERQARAREERARKAAARERAIARQVQSQEPAD